MGGRCLVVILCEVVSVCDTCVGVLAGVKVDGGCVLNCITYEDVGGCAVGQAAETAVGAKVGTVMLPLRQMPVFVLWGSCRGCC